MIKVKNIKLALSGFKKSLYQRIKSRNRRKEFKKISQKELEKITLKSNIHKSDQRRLLQEKKKYSIYRGREKHETSSISGLSRF